MVTVSSPSRGREDEAQPAPQREEERTLEIGVLGEQKDEAEDDQQGQEAELEVLAAAKEVVEVPKAFRDGHDSEQ